MSATKHLSDANFADEVLASPKPVVVDFWAPWCGPCRTLGPVVEQLAQSLGDRATVGKLNVDDNPQAARAYGIESIPTVLVFQGGEVVHRLVGVQPQSQYEAAVNVALAAA